MRCLSLLILSLLIACSPTVPNTAPSATLAQNTPPSTSAMPIDPLARFADLKTDANGKVHLSEAEWQKRLTPMQFEVTRHGATERGGTGEYENTSATGNYHCICCGQLLYSAEHKFHSGCGWPAFDDEVAKGAIEYTQDHSLGMERTEITCARCGAHLGHAFYGENFTKTNARHCVNSASLLFVPKSQ